MEIKAPIESELPSLFMMMTTSESLRGNELFWSEILLDQASPLLSFFSFSNFSGGSLALAQISVDSKMFYLKEAMEEAQIVPYLKQDQLVVQ